MTHQNISQADIVATIPDGIFDNRTNRRRERYKDGEIQTWVSEKAIAHQDRALVRTMPPFGEYPDLPRTCLSCGAKIDAQGNLPCTH